MPQNQKNILIAVIAIVAVIVIIAVAHHSKEDMIEGEFNDSSASLDGTSASDIDTDFSGSAGTTSGTSSNADIVNEFNSASGSLNSTNTNDISTTY